MKGKFLSAFREPQRVHQRFTERIAFQNTRMHEFSLSKRFQHKRSLPSTRPLPNPRAAEGQKGDQPMY